MAAYSSIIIKYLDKSTPIFLRHFEQVCVCPDAWPVGLHYQNETKYISFNKYSKSVTLRQLLSAGLFTKQ